MVQPSISSGASTEDKMRLPKSTLPSLLNRIRNFAVTPFLALAVAACSLTARAQIPQAQSDAAAPAPKDSAQPAFVARPPVDLRSLPKNLFVDQKNFWLAPLHMSQKQWEWAVPLALAGGLLVVGDNNIENHVPKNPTTVSHAVTASNAGVGVLVGAGAGLFLLGHMQKDDQKRETGILSGEAALGAFAEVEVF